MPIAPITELEALITRIESADPAYYDQAAEEKYSDEEYDTLKDRMEEVLQQVADTHPAHPLVQKAKFLIDKVGAPAQTGTWSKRIHEIPMTSLTKAKGAAGITEWWEKTRRNIQ
jgi:NAD-dependent DNA ligase